MSYSSHRLLQGRQDRWRRHRFPLSDTANIVYSYNYHVGKIGLKCRACHYQIFHTAAMNDKKTREDMHTCRSCGFCRYGRQAFDLKTVCAKCQIT